MRRSQAPSSSRQKGFQAPKQQGTLTKYFRFKAAGSEEAVKPQLDNDRVCVTKGFTTEPASGLKNDFVAKTTKPSHEGSLEELELPDSSEQRSGAEKDHATMCGAAGDEINKTTLRKTSRESTKYIKSTVTSNSSKQIMQTPMPKEGNAGSLIGSKRMRAHPSFTTPVQSRTITLDGISLMESTTTKNVRLHSDFSSQTKLNDKLLIPRAFRKQAKTFATPCPTRFVLPCKLTGRRFHPNPVFDDCKNSTENLGRELSNREEARVTWEREPENQYDRQAILVRNSLGQDVGYLERVDSSPLSTLIDVGEVIIEHVVVLRPDNLESKVYPMLAVLRFRTPRATNLAAEVLGKPIKAGSNGVKRIKSLKVGKTNESTVLAKAVKESRPSGIKMMGFSSARNLAQANIREQFLAPRCEEAVRKLAEAICARPPKKYFKDLVNKQPASQMRQKQQLGQMTLFGPSVISAEPVRVLADGRSWLAMAPDNILLCLFDSAVFDFVDVWARLRCVCRSWRDVIEAPSFMQFRKEYWRMIKIHRSDPFRLPPLALHIRSSKVPQLLLIEDLSAFACAIQEHCSWLTLDRALTLAETSTASEPSAEDGWSRFIDERRGSPAQRGELVLWPILLGGQIIRRNMLQALLPSSWRQGYRGPRTELVYLVVRILRTAAWAGSSGKWASVLSDVEHGLFLRERAPGLVVAAPVQSFIRSANPSKSRCPTVEQLAIVQTNLKAGDVVVVRALAGTGKTTALVNYSRMRPHMKFLYLAFNVSVGEEARSLFPENVKCTNLHKLSYARVGRRYKIAEDVDVRSIQQIDKEGDLTTHKIFVVRRDTRLRLPKERLYKLIKMTLKDFLGSADTTIEAMHAQKSLASIDDEDCAEYKDDSLTETALPLEDFLVKLARKLWQAMCSKELPMSSNGHLKLYQLEHVDLSTKFDVIMLDEAQDCTPCARDIVMQQRKCARILIGDPNQAIYQFMGAQDALDVKKHYPSENIQTFLLSRCFRFGADVAAIANGILTHCAKQTHILLGAKPKETHKPGPAGVHWEPQADLEDTSLFASRYEEDQKRPAEERKGTVAFISRSNRGLLEHAFQIAHEVPKAQFGIVGGLQSSPLAMLADLARLALKKTGEIENPFLRRFTSLRQVETYAAQAKESDLNNLLTLLGRIEPITVMNLYSRLEKQMIPWRDARYVLSTVHKSKGLEFDSVYLLSDFQSLVYVDDATQRLSLDPHVDAAEINLLYVAVTRAKQELVINRTLRDIQAAKPYLFGPRLYSASRNDLYPAKCRDCNAEVAKLDQGRLVLGFELQHVILNKVEDYFFCLDCANLKNYMGVHINKQ